MPAISKNLYGKWELVEADASNFDAYMKKCGVGMALRIGAKMMKQTLGIIDDVADGQLHLTTEASMASSDQTFELGDVEQDEKTLDGRRFQVTADGNIHEVQKFNGKMATLDWNSTGADTFDLVLTCEDATCTRKHKRIA